MGSVGLKTHIWNNLLKSVLLLAGFPVLVLAVTYAVALLLVSGQDPTVGEGLDEAARLMPHLIPIALIATAIWYVIAWFVHQPLIAATTGAQSVTRAEEPRLYNLVENLCISRGLTVPSIRIVETDALNAYASGVRKGNYCVTATRGLLDALDDRELEAVLAHEMTHIRNGDVRLLVIATIFVGIVSLGGELIIRSFGWGGWWFPSGRRWGRSRDDGERRGGGGAIILILIAVAIFLVARLLAIVLRLALSRKRELLADAGSVELTKDPDALITALRKIEGRSDIPRVPGDIREMFFDNAIRNGFERLFATHPPIQVRIDALVRYAGGHDPGPLPLAPPPAPETPDAPPSFIPAEGPWGRRGPWG
ncbi:MAG TPA: M48 family metallopeptidase [Hyphomicrobiales bacterium]|nr:M48 family metallopeptidase [Hyphomicrobiales bacterium]